MNQQQEEDLGEAFDLLFVTVQEEEGKEREEDKTSPPPSSSKGTSETAPTLDAARNRADSAANDMGDSDDASDPEKTLHQLAKDGNLKSVIAFLSSSTSSESRVVNRLDSDSMSALHYAARYGHLDVVRELVRSGADPCIKGLEEITPLHLCAK